MKEEHLIVDDVEIEAPVTDVPTEKTTTADDMALPEADRVWKDQVSAREVVAREVVKEGPTPWLSAEEIDDLKSRWNSVQTEFVDDPHTSIKQADELISEAIERFQKALHNQRTELVERWSNHEDVSTEDLRVGLQNYRSFLDRLLTMKVIGS